MKPPTAHEQVMKELKHMTKIATHAINEEGISDESKHVRLGYYYALMDVTALIGKEYIYE